MSDKRNYWTLKDAAADPELRTRVVQAAQRNGQTLVDFVATTLRERADAVLADQGVASGSFMAQVDQMLADYAAEQQRHDEALDLLVAKIDAMVAAVDDRCRERERMLAAKLAAIAAARSRKRE